MFSAFSCEFFVPRTIYRPSFSRTISSPRITVASHGQQKMNRTSIFFGQITKIVPLVSPDSEFFSSSINFSFSLLYLLSAESLCPPRMLE